MSSKTKTTATKVEAMPALVPKLRFPEFREAEGWDADALGDVADFVNQKIPLERVALENYVSTENILPDYGGVARASKLPTTGSVTRYRPNDTLVSNIRPYLKKVWVADKEGGASNDVIVIRAKQSLLPQYLSCLLKNDAFIDYVMTGAKGVKMPRGDVGSMKAYPTLYPFKAEQQKIAECLSSVDELMAAQAWKVDALKTHKKGLMQQLFPREGETQPRLRFPEFQNAGDWEPKRLEDISHSVFDGTHQTPTYTPKGVPFYSVENLISGNANKFISRDDYLLATKKNRPEKGDILITRIGKIGYSQVVTWDHEFSVYVTLAVIKKSKAFNSHFLSHFMQSDFYQSELRAKSLPNAVPPKINLDSLRSTGVLLTNEDEQQRIASCLSSLDALITLESQKLEALKTHKKGLMQQLFPSPDEVEA